MRYARLAAALVVAHFSTRAVQGQGAPAFPPNGSAREWFRDAKFGMFIHWGVYSQLAQGEWVMQNRAIPVDSYEWLASAFNPVKFDAREWVALAKAAGMRYITITSRHHDGFSMFASKATRYNIVDWTPFKRDPLKELADECQRQGIKLFFYYSQLDWHHPDYWPRGRTGLATGRAETGDWNRYLDFMDRAAHGAAHELRPDRRHLVRRHVGQAGCRLAPGADLCADSPAAAGGAHRAEPSQGAAAGRGRADLRAGPARREHRPASTRRRSARCRSRRRSR